LQALEQRAPGRFTARDFRLERARLGDECVVVSAEANRLRRRNPRPILGVARVQARPAQARLERGRPRVGVGEGGARARGVGGEGASARGKGVRGDAECELELVGGVGGKVLRRGSGRRR
jgi:hypothetical protein